MSKYESNSMSVANRIIEDFCEGCDQDPVDCYINNRCKLEEEMEQKREQRKAD